MGVRGGCIDLLKGKQNLNITKQLLRNTAVGWFETAVLFAFARAFNPSGEFCVGDLAEVEYKEEFDIVTAIDILEHIKPDKIPIWIDKLCRALKPGGRLLISVPSINIPVQEKHYQHFTEAKLVEMFEAVCRPVKRAGFMKTGEARKRYKRLAAYAQLLRPFRKKFYPARKFIRYVQDFRRKMEVCDIKKAATIIMVFEKQ